MWQQSHDLHMVYWLLWLWFPRVSHKWKKNSNVSFAAFYDCVRRDQKQSSNSSASDFTKQHFASTCTKQWKAGFFGGRDNLLTVRWDVLSRLLPCLPLHDTRNSLCVLGMGNSSSQWALLFILMMCVLIRTDQVNMGPVSFYGGGTTSRFL